MCFRLILRSVLPTLLLCLINFHSVGWGFWAHARINQLAVFTLVPEMFPFYKAHYDWLGEHAVDPDRRRYAVKAEAPRHYIDLDRYGKLPFDSMPRRWEDAVEQYSADTLLAYGIVPWQVRKTFYRLREAFRERDVDQILRSSSDLGHYIADAHVPLHTTQNYNGQLSGQRGIHAFWESRIPELYAEDYDLLTGKARYLDQPLEVIWKVVLESHTAVDSVLSMEAALNASFGADKKYDYEQRGARMVKTYSREYASAYHDLLNGMVERRMRGAIHLIGSFWFTAWVDAGQPELGEMQNAKFKMPPYGWPASGRKNEKWKKKGGSSERNLIH